MLYLHICIIITNMCTCIHTDNINEKGMVIHIYYFEPQALSLRASNKYDRSILVLFLLSAEALQFLSFVFL